MPGITIKDLFKNNNSTYKFIFRFIKIEKTINIEKYFNKIGKKQLPEMRITYNVSFTDIYVSFSARIYSVIFLKTRVILSGYSVPALINIGTEIYLILKKIINKINVMYILSRRIAIINASKEAIYIEEIYNN